MPSRLSYASVLEKRSHLVYGDGMGELYPNGIKGCIDCGESLPVEMFTLVRPATGVRRSHCKPCGVIRTRKNRERNPDTKIDYDLRKKYGITLAEYRYLHEAQEGRCAICGKGFTDDRYGKGFVDHDHETGTVRALLCKECNLGIGQFGDCPDTLIKAAEYLRGFH